MPTARPDLIKWDSERDEPYLILPSFPELRVTPFRRDDGPGAMKLYNEPGVAKYSYRRPYPYLPEHLDHIWNFVIPTSTIVIDSIWRPLLKEHQNVSLEPDGKIPFSPFKVIRHAASNEVIGDLAIFDSMNLSSGGSNGSEGPKETEQGHAMELAYNILPEWRGKGLGGEVIGVLIEAWVLQTSLTAVMATAETLNPASGALLRSRGFKRIKTYMVQWPEDKGGGEREVSEWKLELAEYVSKLPPRET